MLTLTPTPDELALKQQVTDTLAREGVLAKIKAELRAAVFRVMHERAVPPTASASTLTLSAFPEPVASTAVELIAECLAFFQWDHSLLVLRAEADLDSRPLQVDGEKLAQTLKLREAATSAPVLLQLVEERLAGVEPAGEPSRAMRSLGKGVDSFVAEHYESRPLVSGSMPAAKQQQEQLHEEEEDEEPMKAVTERAGEHLEHGSTLERDEDDRGGFIDNVEEPLSRAGAFVPHYQVDEQSDGEEDAAADKCDHKEAAGVDDGADEDDEEDEELELEESMAEDIASGSEYEESRELASPEPPSRATHQETAGNAEDQDDDDRAVLPPPVPTQLAPPHPLESVRASLSAEDHDGDDGNARDEASDTEDEAARLSSLDAKLKAMEAEDDTGTLQQLKASLQLELQRGDDGAKHEEDEDGDGDGYGSSDFEEEEIASDISEEVESALEVSDREEEADGSEREVSVPAILRGDLAVEGEDALNSYDYIEAVERAW